LGNLEAVNPQETNCGEEATFHRISHSTDYLFRQFPHDFSPQQINTYSISKAHSELDQQYSISNASE